MKKLLIAIVFLLFPILASANTVPDGATIKTANNPDVYIVKYNNGKQFRRLVLNPQVFESYGHLKWENIVIVAPEVMNSYTISNIVRVESDPKVYALAPNGDSGSKSWLNVAAADFIAVGGDWDSVYIINAIDGANYNIATDLSTQSQVRTFLTSNILPRGIPVFTPMPTIMPSPTPTPAGVILIDSYLENPSIANLKTLCTEAKTTTGVGIKKVLNDDKTSIVEVRQSLYEDLPLCRFVVGGEIDYVFVVYDPSFIIPLTDQTDSDEIRTLKIQYNEKIKEMEQYGIFGFLNYNSWRISPKEEAGLLLEAIKETNSSLSSNKYHWFLDFLIPTFILKDMKMRF